MGALQAATVSDKPCTQGKWTPMSDPPRQGKYGRKQRYGSGVAVVSPYVHEESHHNLPVKKASTFREVPTPEGSVKLPIHFEESVRFVPKVTQLQHLPHGDTRLQPYPQRFFR